MIDAKIIIDISLYGICLVFLFLQLFIVFRYMVFPKPKLELIRNMSLRKCDFMKSNIKENKEKYLEEMKEYKLSKQLDRVPSKFSRLTCIILSEGHTAKILYMPFFKESFRYMNCVYFITNSHNCDNNAKLLIYLEGVSLPISCENIVKEQVKRKFIDIDGIEKESIITVIKGLKYDGKMLDIFANREFAKNFNSSDTNIAFILVIILSVIILALTCVSIAISYLFR